MAVHEAITLHTQPVGGETSDKTHHIVGVELGKRALWAMNRYTRQELRDHPEERSTTPLTIEAPHVFGVRLAAFFDRYYQDRRDGDLFNSHRFAFWMTGSVAIRYPGFLSQEPALMEAIKTGDEREGGLEIGEHGVIGRWNRSVPQPFHSVIGLGSDGDLETQCLQVQGQDGPLLITSYAQSIVNYSFGEDRSYLTPLKLYAVDQGEAPLE